VLSVKLKYLDEWHEGRRRNAEDYNVKLAGVEGLALPQVAEYGSGDGKAPYHIYNQYTIRVTNGRRDAVVAGMKERGIGCEVYYPVCLHEQECFAFLGYSEGDLPNSEAAAREVLSVPIYPELTEAQRDEVVGALKELVAEPVTAGA
jgi:dTDP-4-amino-4,6-dideoxygalactose transaminase